VVGRDLGAGGGALATFELIARLGLGGKVGKGTQGMSWIHKYDLNILFAKAISIDSMSGVYIVSAPNSVPQAEFMSMLRKVIKMPLGLPPWSGWSASEHHCSFAPIQNSLLMVALSSRGGTEGSV